MQLIDQCKMFAYLCLFEKPYRKCFDLSILFFFLNPWTLTFILTGSIIKKGQHTRSENIVYMWKKVSKYCIFVYLNYYNIFFYIWFKTGFFPEKVRDMRCLIVILIFICPWRVCSLSKFTLFYPHLVLLYVFL